jgi:DNA-binding NarL/FixJ family response regulator
VRNHVNHILEKLEASDRTEAVSIAMQQGVISVSS